MHLNGWQRLWVGILAMWTVTVLVFFVMPYWSVGTIVSESEVFERMSPDTGEAFVDYSYWRNEPTSYKPLKGQTVVIGGQMVSGVDGISRSAMDTAATDYDTNLRAVRNQKRSHFATVTTVMTVLPAVALYAFGWLVAWVRQRFPESTPE